MPWGEPLYRDEAIPSLERSDRVRMQGGQGQGCWDSPGAQGYSYASVGHSQYGRPEVPGTTFGASVGGQIISNREVSFAPLPASEGGSLGLPERFSVTSSSWSPSNSSSRSGRNTLWKLRVSGTMVANNGDCFMLSLGHWLDTMAGMMMTVS